MKKILILEDDPTVGFIYKTRLQKEGYEVDLVTDGQAGFYRIYDFLPDAVLLDLMLPKMNGVEILKKIRTDTKFSKLPILVFTNAYVTNMISDCFLAGATRVFNKSVLTPKKLAESLQELLAEENAGDFSASDSAEHSTEKTTRPGGAQPLGLPNWSEDRDNESAKGLQVSPTEKDSEELSEEARLLEDFLASAPEMLARLRKTTQELAKAQDEASRLSHLLEAYRQVHAFGGSAGVAGLRPLSQMAAALEVLLNELYDKPAQINASTMRTVAHSVDFLAELSSTRITGDFGDTKTSKLLVVDDEILSRRAITFALEKGGLESTSVEESHVALDLATRYTFYLIFLDVQMPGMNGFDLCTKIRALPSNKETPIIFVTSLTDIANRAKSTLSGGTDFIAKPFMFIELTVKALTHVLRGQLRKHKMSHSVAA